MSNHKSIQYSLRTLLKHSELIADIYNNNAISETEGNSSAIEELRSAKMVWAMDTNSEYRLSKSLKAFLVHALKDQTNRRIDLDTSNRLEEIANLARMYISAKNRGSKLDVETYYADIYEFVAEFLQTLEENTTTLWTHIGTQFGYVTSLDAKINECEHAIGRVKKLTESLMMIEIGELYELTAGDQALFRILVQEMQKGVQRCQNDLENASKKLGMLMGEFRRINHTTLLVKGFNAFLKHNPSYGLPDLTECEELKDFSLIAGCIHLAPSVDTCILSMEGVLAEIVAETDVKIREDTSGEPIKQELADELNVDQAVYEPEPDLLAVEVDEFLSQCLDGNAHSAKEYYVAKSPDWSFEAWLYCLFDCYSYLDEEDKAVVRLETEEITHPCFSGNNFIKDVRVAINVQ